MKRQALNCALQLGYCMERALAYCKGSALGWSGGAAIVRSGYPA